MELVAGRAPRVQAARVLVTGTRGFLGRHVMAGLRGLAGHLHLHDGDMRTIGDLRERYDLVCHLAGVTRGAGGEGTAEGMFEGNVTGTAAIMEYCRRTGARCVFASSAAVYAPTSEALPLDEHAPTHPTNCYGLSKLLAEQLCRFYADRYGVNTVILRVFNPYGAGQPDTFLIPYALGRLLRGEPVVLKAPEAVRDWIGVADVAQAFVRACQASCEGVRIWNIGTGTGVRVVEVVERLAVILGVTARIESPEGATASRDAVIADVGAMAAALGWRAEIALDRGLAQMVEAREPLSA